MKTLTYFRAYQEAVYWCTRYEQLRGTRQGIAVKDDVYARCWQRCERKAHKFEKRILQRLEWEA